MNKFAKKAPFSRDVGEVAVNEELFRCKIKVLNIKSKTQIYFETRT